MNSTGENEVHFRCQVFVVDTYNAIYDFVYRQVYDGCMYVQGVNYLCYTAWIVVVIADIVCG